MSAAVRLGLLVAVVLAGVAPWLARPAYACSGVPGNNPVSNADLIVAGRVLGWERTGGARQSGVPIHIRVAVDWTLKGVAGPDVTIADSLQADGRWGAESLCQAFSRDPTGVYVVLGLRRAGDGTYSTSLFSRFSLGPEPDSVAYQRALERVAANGESTLNLAEPRPCIPLAGAAFCDAERRSLWEGEAGAWAARGVSGAQAAIAATVALRAEAGDQATIAALARAQGIPYVQIHTVRYLSQASSPGPQSRTFSEEFVTLANLGGTAEDLSGWVVQSPDRGRTVELPAGTVLMPGRSCRLARSDDSFSQSGGCVAAFDLDDLWPDDAGRVLLVDPDGIIRADVRYSADPYNQPPPPNLEGVRLPR